MKGCLLSFPQSLVVNDSYTLARFGELLLADKRLMVSTEVKKPGAEAATFEQQQQLGESLLMMANKHKMLSQCASLLEVYPPAMW